MSIRPTPCRPATAFSRSTSSCPGRRSPSSETGTPDSKPRTTSARLVRRAGHVARERPDVVRGDVPGVLQRAALVGDVPQVAVAAVDLRRRRGARDAPLVEVGEQVLAGTHLPLAPRRDHAQVRGQRRDRALEADLVVALARAAVRHRDRADAARQLDLRLGDDRAGRGRAEEVRALVHGVRHQRREGVVLDELAAQVLDVARRGPRRARLLLEPLQLAVALADVRGEGDHLAPVRLDQPRNDRGRVQPARVRQHHLVSHRIDLPRCPSCSRRAASVRPTAPAATAGSRSARACGSPPGRRRSSAARRSPRRRPRTRGAPAGSA